ncbi:MAG: peptide ABC transporter substrate-binding protein [Pseudomonadota bacterium]
MLKRFFGKTFFILCGLAFATSVQAETVFNRGNSGEPATLDPHKHSTVQESHISRDMWEGLVQYNAEGNVIPGSAESWTMSPDGKVYTFKIRTGAKWSNGEPLTAEDFVYSFRRMLDPKTAAQYASILYPVKNAEEVNAGKMKPEELAVRALDAQTFEVTLRGPIPYFTEMLTHTAAFPVNRANLEKFGDDWVKPENIVSNGPYVVSEFVPKDRVVLVKNKNYYDAGKLKIDTVKYIPIEDRATALKRFEAREIDSYDQFHHEQMEYIRTNLKGEFFTGPYLGTYYYAVNATKAPFNNPTLRRALALAIDREYLAEKIFTGSMIAGYSIVPPGIKGYTAAEYDFKDRLQLDREDEARKIMEELGYNKDKRLTLEIRYNTAEEHKACAVAVADMWKNIYVDTKYINTDGKSHYEHLRNGGDYDVGRVGWIGDFKDPQTFLATAQTGDSNNHSRYSNPKFDELMLKAEQEMNAQKRFDDLSKAEKIAMDDAAYIVLVHYSYHNLVAKKVKGFEQNIMDVHPTKWMSIDSSRS